MAFPDAPILSDMILELIDAGREAEERAEAASNVLADLEALHEPDAFGRCPTCQSYAPCPSLLLLRREVTLEDAFEAVRDNQPPANLQESEVPVPTVPSLQEMLATPAPTVDRVFETLIGRTPSPDGDNGTG